MAVGLDVDERNRIIGDNLRKYRLLKGMTQDELADGLCSVSQLSKVENGKTYVKRTMLKQMADRLGVTVERIESADALMEELKETLQLAKDAHTAKNLQLSLSLVQNVLDRSREYEYHMITIDAFLQLISVQLGLKDYEAVVQTAEELLQNPQIDSGHRIVALFNMGNAFEMSGDLRAAYDCYIRADEEYITSDQEDPSVQFNIAYCLAKSNSLLGNYRNGIRYAEKAEELAKQESWHLKRIRASCMRAIPLRRLGRIDQAEQIYLANLKEAQENSYLIDVGIINNNLGEIHQDRGEYGQALMHYHRALSICDLMQEDMRLYKCETLLHLAEIAHSERNNSEAREFLRKIIDIAENVGTSAFREKAKALYLLGQICLAEQKFDDYIANLVDAQEITEKHYVSNVAYDIAIELAEFFYQRGDSRAVDMYRQAVEYNKSLIQIRR